MFLLLVSICIIFSSTGASILKITVQAPIHPITAEYIVRTIDEADSTRSELVLIEMNTPGGLDSSMREIIEAVVNSKTPVVLYVAPSGGRAASAGLYIAIACDVFAMAPGTNTGAAHPVSISLIGQQTDETMEDKVTHDAASYIRTLAEKRGRNMVMAEEAVRKSLSYTESEALKGGLIDLVAGSSDELLRLLDGRKIKRFNGQEQILELKDVPVKEIPLSFRQRFLLTISNPNLAYILLMIGLLGLYFEFSHPGAILPGVLGGISLLLAIFSFQILPINYVGLMLIILAMILFILEIKIQSYGMLSVGGIAAMIIGSMMLISSPIPELRPSLGYIIPVALGTSLIVIFLVYLVFKAHARRSFTGRDGLVRETGMALTDLAPSGKVFVHGEIWKAEGEDVIKKGDQVEVIKVLDGLKLLVRRK